MMEREVFGLFVLMLLLRHDVSARHLLPSSGIGSLSVAFSETHKIIWSSMNDY
jgi:hypothetical protein